MECFAENRRDGGRSRREHLSFRSGQDYAKPGRTAIEILESAVFSNVGSWFVTVVNAAARIRFIYGEEGSTQPVNMLSSGL